MAISRARKEELVAQYTDLLNESDGFVVVRTSGMTVPQVQALRGAIYEAEGNYVRTKNTLFRIALNNTGWTTSDELIKGPIAVAFGKGNFPGVAKAVLKHIKDAALEEKLKVTGGVMAEEVLDAESVKAVSELPTLDELRAQIIGLVVSPATGIVNVLNSANSQIVNVLQAYLDDRGGGDDDANEDEAA